MTESFGARLRQRREQRQVALATIAEQTKIKLSLLEALERDDVSHWPGGIFRRAFIRAYAHAIGLEPDVVVREFLELYPDPFDVVETPPAGSASPGGDARTFSGGPPTRFRYLVGSAMGSLSRLGIVQNAKPSGAVEDPAPASCPPAMAAVASEPDVTVVACEPDVTVLAPLEPDLLAVAQICTELGRIDDAGEALPLLGQAAAILDAVGLIVWVWDPETVELRPALAHGYSANVLTQLPRVSREADNATAAAFRSGQPCVVDGSDRANGALVVPLVTSAGCVGAFAVELQNGAELRASVRAVITMIAAQLARLAGRPAEADSRRLA
jgi:transcriptional regulator with XRE-family HTH domain